MPRNNQSQAPAEENREAVLQDPYAAALSGSGPRMGQLAVPRWAFQFEATRRQARRRIKHLRRRLQRDIERRAAKIESDIAAGEKETARWNDSVKRTDSEAFGLMKAYQQSEYEYYAGTDAPDPSRRVED